MEIELIYCSLDDLDDEITTLDEELILEYTKLGGRFIFYTSKDSYSAYEKLSKYPSLMKSPLISYMGVLITIPISDEVLYAYSNSKLYLKNNKNYLNKVLNLNKEDFKVGSVINKLPNNKSNFKDFINDSYQEAIKKYRDNKDCSLLNKTSLYLNSYFDVKSRKTLEIHKDFDPHNYIVKSFDNSELNNGYSLILNNINPSWSSYNDHTYFLDTESNESKIASVLKLVIDNKLPYSYTRKEKYELIANHYRKQNCNEDKIKFFIRHLISTCTDETADDDEKYELIKTNLLEDIPLIEYESAFEETNLIMNFLSQNANKLEKVNLTIHILNLKVNKKV
jgi:hypothetical protein